MKTKTIGILTAGGDCPGLNAAIRGVAKAASGNYGMDVIGILDGFRGLVENRVIHLSEREMTGLLTLGGTILGSSRVKPYRYPTPDGAHRDMTGAAVETCRRLNLDCLVCIGGGGTAKNALHLSKQGINVITLPKTIDNDVAETDMTFGFDSGMTIATEAIDRLHTTASSHHRIMVVDIMGHNAGWLALGASLAGGADVCLIPEIPYKFDAICRAIEARENQGKRFSLISVAEGARPFEVESKPEKKPAKPKKKSKKADQEEEKIEAEEMERQRENDSDEMAEPSFDMQEHLEKALGIETRVTTLGYIQRGGIPTPTDRVLATELGIAAAKFINEGLFGVMVAIKEGKMVPVALEKVAGRKKTVPLDHPWIETARMIGLALGD